MERVIQLFRLIKKNKLKLLALLISCLFFLFVLFPLDDLSDLVSSQISKMTQNSVYLQFDEMNLSIVPQPGISVSNVYIETISTPALTAKELIITPSANGLIRKQPYGHVAARGILSGDIDLWLNQGTRTEAGVERHKIEVTAKQVSLQDIRNLADLPVQIKGQLNLEGSALADLTFAEQPEMDLSVNVEKFELPPSNVNTEMGPLTLPDLKLSLLDLKGKLSGGKFIIENGSLGKESDEFYGKIKGNLALTFSNNNGIMTPQVGGYSVELEFSVKKSFQDKAGVFLSLLDNYKTATPQGASYKLKISAPNTYMPPSFSAIR